MPRRRTSHRSVVASERLLEDIDALTTLARERGRASRRARGGDEPDARDDTAQEFLRDELRQLLEDEVVPAYPDDPSVGRSELEREVVKKALVGLHLHTLRRMAEGYRLDKRGNAEDLATRIARYYKYDSGEVAKLILDNEEEPRPERGHVSRLFPMVDDIDVSAATERIRVVLGRLVRAGVARWVEVKGFDEDEAATEIAVDVTLRSYKAFVDEIGEEPNLGSTPSSRDASVVLRDGHDLLITEDADPNTARTVARGVAGVINATFAEGLALSTPTRGRLAGFDPRTVLLLDLIYSRLDVVGVGERNLTIARFVTDKGDEHVVSPEEAGEHSLKAVRLEGHHLLDSNQACELIAKRGRGLVDMSLWVAVPKLMIDGGTVPWFPMRFTVERDHLAILTGFGRHSHEHSLGLHQDVVKQAEAALVDGPADVAELENLAVKIAAVAESGEVGAGTLRKTETA